MLKSDMTARNTVHNAPCIPKPMHSRGKQKKKRKTCVYQVPAAPLSIDFVNLVIFVLLFLFYFRLWSSPLSWASLRPFPLWERPSLLSILPFLFFLFIISIQNWLWLWSLPSLVLTIFVLPQETPFSRLFTFSIAWCSIVHPKSSSGWFLCDNWLLFFRSLSSESFAFFYFLSLCLFFSVWILELSFSISSWVQAQFPSLLSLDRSLSPPLSPPLSRARCPFPPIIRSLTSFAHLSLFSFVHTGN